MGFKLGKSKGNNQVAGEIKSKMAFKKSDTNIYGVDINFVKLDENTLAEANNDGTISVNKNMDINDPMMQRTIAHEVQHLTQMKIGNETFDDNNVYYNGEVWPRLNGYILNPHTGEKHHEGDKELPWEKNKID